jgi:Glycosyltransferase Family 4
LEFSLTWGRSPGRNVLQRAIIALAECLQGSGLRILITNAELGIPSGTTVYVRDLALELKRRGHEPVVYTLALGAIARELLDAGIFVTRHLKHITIEPELIHGHHWLPTSRALRCFPSVPAIYICHDHTSYHSRPVFGPQVRRYFGVSRLCVARLIHDGVPPEAAELILNFVDTRRFVARDGLPPRPRRALIFSNNAHAGTHLPAVAEACRRAGLEFDVVGKLSGNCVARPESVLWRYDLIFAKAKASMEAMASGAAVVLCDFGGVGPLVTSENFARLRRVNFGFEALVDPLTPESVLRQMERYDPEDAARVCTKVHSTAGLESAVEDLLTVYEEGIGSKGVSVIAPVRRSLSARATGAIDVVRSLLFAYSLILPTSARMALKKTPGVAVLWRRLQGQKI